MTMNILFVDIFLYACGVTIMAIDGWLLLREVNDEEAVR